MIFTRTENPEEIIQAKHLLYTHYLLRLGWNLPQNTPTGWIVRDAGNLKILDDSYSAASIWYVGQENGTIETCIRVMLRQRAQRLDVENYNHTPALQEFITHHPNCGEINRFGFLHDSHREYYATNLFLCILNDAEREQWTILITDGMRSSEMFAQIRIRCIPGTTFKYHPQDEHEINVYGMTADDFPRLRTMCRQRLREFPLEHRDHLIEM